MTVAGTLCLAWLFAQMFKHLAGAGGSYGFMRLALGDSAAFLGAWGLHRLHLGGQRGDHDRRRRIPHTARAAAGGIAGGSADRRGGRHLAADMDQPERHARGRWCSAGVDNRQAAAVRRRHRARRVATLPQPAESILPPVHADSFSFAGASAAVGFTMSAMLGFESAAVPADVVENPERNVPIATTGWGRG